MINFSIASDLVDLYPRVCVGFFTAAGQPDQLEVESAARLLAENSLQSLASRKIDIDNLADTQPFSSWRRAFAKGGLQPSKYRSSVEALVRRALRSDQPVLIGNPIVDI
jgi:lysyl-tRNA synthetase class 2